MESTQVKKQRPEALRKKDGLNTSVTAAELESRATPPPESSSGRKVTRLDRWLVARLLKATNDPPFAIRMWNGEVIASSDSAPEATVDLAGRRTLWKLIRDPFFQFGEAYSSGELRIEGVRLVEFLRLLSRAIEGEKAADKPPRRWWPFGRGFLGKTARRNTPDGSQRNIHHHYDIGNEFYRLWLDEQLLYTCAYFERPEMTLEEAQVAKMDHVCRKVWLQPGETVVEAGCGWGAFALHMARHYGVTVRAFNISKEQIAYARDRAKREGLDDRVEFVQDDWRNITGRYDAFVSIGMLEHVGPENYEQLGGVVRRCLNENGRGLIHSIGQNQPRPFDRWIERRIFPGAYPPTLAEMMDIFENNALSVLDVENIRLHYAQTLAHWLDRFEQQTDRVAEMFDEEFVRAWRLYLAGSFAAFEADRLQLYQALFSPMQRNAIPRNRRYQYEGDHQPTLFSPTIEVVDATRSRTAPAPKTAE